MFEVFDVFWISTHQSTWRVQRDGAAVFFFVLFDKGRSVGMGHMR